MIFIYSAFIQNSFDKIIKITIRTESRPDIVLVASQGLEARWLVSHQVGAVPREGQGEEPVIRLGALVAASLTISVDKIVEIAIRAKAPPDLIFASLGKTVQAPSSGAKSDCEPQDWNIIILTKQCWSQALFDFYCWNPIILTNKFCKHLQQLIR